jgi:IS30 family transposase
MGQKHRFDLLSLTSGLPLPAQPVDATQALNLSAGVSNCKVSRLRRSVAGKLRLDWSPEQIAGWLKRAHPEDEYNQVSHETIYRSLGGADKPDVPDEHDSI